MILFTIGAVAVGGVILGALSAAGRLRRTPDVAERAFDRRYFAAFQAARAARKHERPASDAGLSCPSSHSHLGVE